MRTLTSLLLIFAAATTTPAQTVTLVADLPRLDRPKGLAVDAQGTVYAATEPDIACVSPTGEVHDLAGGLLAGETSDILAEDTGAVVVTDRGIFSQGVFLHRVLRITPGIELTVQCIVQDTGLPAGITLSNAVRAVTP